MLSLKMKSKVNNCRCFTEKTDLHVCPNSKVISKRPCSKIIFPDQVASSRTPVSLKVVASDEPINRNECGNKENSESQHQQSFSLDSSAVREMEPTNPCTANIERTVSPSFEPTDIHSQDYNQGDAGRIGDTGIPEVSADKSDEKRSICGYETCDVSDFFISEMQTASLPFGDYYNDDNFEIINYISSFESYEPTLFDVPVENMVLPALEDDVNVGRTEDSITCEESMMVQENDSLYSALSQAKRNSNEDSDAKNDSDKTECFDPQLFIKNFTKLSDVESNDLFTQMAKHSPRRKSLTLVLDLDETLVHSTLKHSDDSDFTFKVVYKMKESTIYVRQRPNLHTFLEAVAEMFEVVIFTASESIYAQQLLDIMDPDGRLISRRLYRESCIFSDGHYIKDLTVLGVDLSKVVIIDNSPRAFGLQVNNGIPIKSWYDDPLDCELMSSLPFLEILADSDDVRPIIAQQVFHNKD